MKEIPKPISQTMWAYFAPDGYLQVRTLGDDKEQAREMIARNEFKTYKDYEKEGFFLAKVRVNIKIV